MKLRKLLALLPIVMALSLTACPKKKEEGDPQSTEPVEGASTGNNEKSTDGPSDEMQEKAGKDSEPGAATEEKKE